MWVPPCGYAGPMALRRKSPLADIDENEVEVGHPKNAAAGVPAVAVAMKRSVDSMGPAARRAALLKLNQVDGFDCQGCAWPDPDPAPAHGRVLRERRQGGGGGGDDRPPRAGTSSPQHSIEDLQQHTDYWLGHQGRLIHPMVRRRDATHYEPISWDEAFELIGADAARTGEPGRGDLLHLRQDLQRGRLRLPALRPRLRHQQPPRLLQHVPRVHLGGPRRDHRHRQGLGQPRRRPRGRADRDQRPEPRHQPPADADRPGEGEEERRQDPRDQPARRGGADEVQEPADARGRARRRAPVSPTCTCPSGSTATSRCGRRSAACSSRPRRPPGTTARCSTATSSSATPPASRTGRETSGTSTGPRSRRATGLTRSQIEEAADMLLASDATVHCWAMGITQHRNAVATIKEFVNVALPAGQHRQARCRPLPGARALQRAGRPDHGHLGEGARPLPRRAPARSTASSRRASTGSTPSTRSAPCATARRRSSSGWAATSSPPRPTRWSPRRRWSRPS